MPKKKNNTNDPLPFQELNTFTTRYPTVWNYCDDIIPTQHNVKK